ncbi:hypothetical protein Btru_070497 [Bulinus truncatus]|nr:hypothetical protein Btru_070497 [Bulinus truncatus]
MDHYSSTRKGIHTAGFDSTDEKFLAIVLGSTAACVVIIIIIFAITFYTKKSRCHSPCDPDSHIYSSAEADDTHGVEINEKTPPEDIESETDLKGSEAEYAEIGDSRLPRYTDIFKESSETNGDPFNKATAPPLYSEINSKTYVNSQRSPCSLSSSIEEISVENISANPDGSIQQQKLTIRKLSGEVKYYNVREKKKKRRANSYESSPDKSGQIHEEFVLNGINKNRLSNVSCEMRKSSAGKDENSKKILKQKRRSAPLDSNIPLDIKVARSYSTSTCSVIHETHHQDKHRNLKQKNTGQIVTENTQSLFVTPVNNEKFQRDNIEPPVNNERDSLLKTPSCHSVCDSQECEVCFNYDRVKYSDNDLSSIHLYQCLDETNNISQIKQNHFQKSQSHNSL